MCEHEIPTSIELKSQIHERGGVDRCCQQQEWLKRVERGKKGYQPPLPTSKSSKFRYS